MAKNHSQIVIEDLNVSGMMSNHKLAKAVADMGFYEFRRQLEYKCQLYGSKLWSTNMKTAVSKNCTDSNRRKKTVENHNSFYQDNWINQYRLYRTAHYSLGTLCLFYKAAYNSNK